MILFRLDRPVDNSAGVSGGGTGTGLVLLSIISLICQITQPELVVHVSKARRVVLPVAEKIQFPALASEENLTDEDEETKTGCVLLKKCVFIRTHCFYKS